ncbi:MAG: hypothetical protein OXR73_13690 [Myxococcales bacterium]|nr:hypothetical protein [Myxococcales bacterium]
MLSPRLQRCCSGLLGCSLWMACGGQSGGEILDRPPVASNLAVCPCTLSAQAVMVRGTILAADACAVRVRIDQLVGGVQSALGPGDEVVGSPEPCSDPDLVEGDDVLGMYAPEGRLFARRWARSYEFPRTPTGVVTLTEAELGVLTVYEACYGRLGPPQTWPDEQEPREGPSSSANRDFGPIEGPALDPDDLVPVSVDAGAPVGSDEEPDEVVGGCPTP